MAERHAEEYIDHFVALVLGHIDREYPNKLDHVMNDAAEVKPPRELHPIFYGSFDWHSCVHGHWLLARALRCYPGLGQKAEVMRVLGERFTEGNVKTEVEYLARPRRETFERTYGWAWLLKLGAELRLGTAQLGGAPDTETIGAMSRWGATLEPLMDAFAERLKAYLPKATYPIRVGVHQNTAFALRLAMDYAHGWGLGTLEETIRAKARAWYLKDENYPAWEPDGTDFLSPGLVEAECMRRMLEPAEFVAWFDRFFPRLAKGEKEPATLFVPAFVSDRTDGQITHLDGLNLSRAWCWRSIGKALPEGDARRALCEEAYTTHLDSALPHVTGDYMGEHWLATFALLAMTE
jgi:hypothetical protein